jgi:hypothetical protein
MLSAPAPSDSDRLCASCGFVAPDPTLRDGYALHAGQCLTDYSLFGPRYTPERLLDRFLVLVYDGENF